MVQKINIKLFYENIHFRNPTYVPYKFNIDNVAHLHKMIYTRYINRHINVFRISSNKITTNIIEIEYKM
jgi:hypothetical protein